MKKPKESDKYIMYGMSVAGKTNKEIAIFFKYKVDISLEDFEPVVKELIGRVSKEFNS